VGRSRHEWLEGAANAGLMGPGRCSGEVLPGRTSSSRSGGGVSHVLKDREEKGLRESYMDAREPAQRRALDLEEDCAGNRTEAGGAGAQTLEIEVIYASRRSQASGAPVGHAEDGGLELRLAERARRRGQAVLEWFRQTTASASRRPSNPAPAWRPCAGRLARGQLPLQARCQRQHGRLAASDRVPPTASAQLRRARVELRQLLAGLAGDRARP